MSMEFNIENNILTKYTGDDGEVVIPEGVTKIGNWAFEGRKDLTSVTIPAGVTEIGKSAFRNCAGLKSVTIPAGVTAIGEGAFSGCAMLESAVIPEGVTVIGGWAFSGCRKLQSANIPKGVTEIGYSTFEGCVTLESAVIPEGVTSIGDYAFAGCIGMRSVTIPESVTEIGDWAFDNCMNLKVVAIPKGVTKIDTLFGRCHPMMIAPHIPITNFSREDKTGACVGFAKRYVERVELDEKASYLKYMKGQKKRLIPLAVQYEELLQLLMDEKLLVRKDIDLLLEECGKQENEAAKVVILDYVSEHPDLEDEQ